MVLSHNDTNILSHVRDNNLVQTYFRLDEKRCAIYKNWLKVISHCDPITKLNFVKFVDFGLAYREFVSRKFLSAKISAVNVTLMGSY